MGQACDLPGFQPQTQASQDSSESDLSEDGDSVSCDSPMEYMPQHEHWFTHSLQLVMRDGLRSSTQSTIVLAKVSSIAAHIRESTIASDLLEDNQDASRDSLCELLAVILRRLLSASRDSLCELLAVILRRLLSASRDSLCELLAVILRRLLSSERFSA
ncbi:UNVERIFIED_CONTAM: hypothetical protein FKN15_031247 [Acipenser sinensis]